VLILGEPTVAPDTSYLFRSVVRRDSRDPVAMPIGKKDSKGYHPRMGDFNLDEFYLVNHGKRADERWTLARLTEIPKLVETTKYGSRWQCKVMLYAKNGLAKTTMKFLPERRKGTRNGWDTVNCQSLSFLARKLPGKASNKEITETHKNRLAEVLKEWDNAVESEEEEEAEQEGDGEVEEEEEEAEDPSYEPDGAAERESEGSEGDK